MADGRDQEIDVFVSFAPADDQPLGEGGPGLVAALCTALQRFAKIHLSRELRVAVSGELSGPATGDPPPIGSPENARLFVAVLSPAYVHPGSMERSIEAETFAVGAGDRATSRMYCAVTEPVEPSRVLASLRGVPTYDLHDEQGVSTLMVAASDLARDIAAALGGEGLAPAPKMRSDERLGGMAPERPSQKRQTTVFLAHTDDDLRTQRDELRAELKRRGFTVVPEGPPRGDRAGVLEEASEALVDARFSVHLLKDRYDEAAHLECEAAGQKAASGGLERFVWLGVEEEPVDPVLRALFDAVEAAPDGTKPFRRTSLETFKTALLDALGSETDPTEPESPDAEKNPELKYVYLVFDQTDEKWTLRLQRYLGRRCVVWTPLFAGTAREIDRQHRDYLSNCDASLVVYGDAPQAWWKTRTREFSLRGQPGSHVSRAYYMVEPMTREKHGFSEPRTRVIRAGERFSRGDVDGFLEGLGVGVDGANGSGDASPAGSA